MLFNVDSLILQSFTREFLKALKISIIIYQG